MISLFQFYKECLEHTTRLTTERWTAFDLQEMKCTLNDGHSCATHCKVELALDKLRHLEDEYA